MASTAPSSGKAIIRTFTGRMVDMERPTPDDIDLRDIAHALANINRFTGHTPEPYTVAEHCVLGSEIIRGEFALQFLFHDAHEAYLGDVSGPLKKIMGGCWEHLAAGFDRVIAQKFDLGDDDDRAFAAYDVAWTDRLMLDVELDRLMGLRMRAGSWAQRNPAAERIYTRLGRREGDPELRFLERADQLLRRARR